jgi:hypothetical protein
VRGRVVVVFGGRGGCIEARAAAGWMCKAQWRAKGGHHHRFPKKGGK